MLQIDIVGSNGDNLDLIVNNRPNNGKSMAKKGWAVHWKVDPQCDVDYIAGISMKEIAGSTDIFSANPPTAESGSQGKIWKARVNGDARRYSVYVYNIFWVKEGETTPRTFDPIIAIKPRADLTTQSLMTTVGVLAVIGVSYVLFGQRSKLTKIWK